MIGEKIRKIRTLKGYSQEYMSDKLSISQPAYSDIENNKTKTSIDSISEIANVFDMDVVDLLIFDEKMAFNNTFNENSKGFFNVKKVINESFENERKAYLDQITTLKSQLDYFKGELNKYK